MSKKCPQILPEIDQNKQLKDQDLDPSNCRSGFGSRGSTNVDPLRIRIANTVHNTKENAKALFLMLKRDLFRKCPPLHQMPHIGESMGPSRKHLFL